MSDDRLLREHKTLQRLVEREVIHCCSAMVSQLAEGVFRSDEMDEELHDVYYPQPLTCDEMKLSHVMFDKDGNPSVEVVARGKVYRFDDDNCEFSDYLEDGELLDEEAFLEEALDTIEGLESHESPVEVYEHWIVSAWLGEHLKSQGEVVGELFDFTVWGRQCTGQAIYLDGVIRRVAEALEILPGQRCEWEAAK